MRFEETGENALIVRLRAARACLVNKFKASNATDIKRIADPERVFEGSAEQNPLEKLEDRPGRRMERSHAHVTECPLVPHDNMETDITTDRGGGCSAKPGI